jgi:hypothetical protein
MLKLTSSIIFALFLISTAFAEQQLIQTVQIDCKENCAIHGSRKWEEKAIEIKLPPGKYKFVPMKGACSSWPNDQSAFDTGNQPWIWYAIISVNGGQYELGSQAKYKTPNTALKEGSSRKSVQGSRHG